MRICAGLRLWCVTEVGNLHPMTPGSVTLASIWSGPQLPHTDVATHREALPLYGRDIWGCHLSSLLCFSEEYHVRSQAEPA